MAAEAMKMAERSHRSDRSLLHARSAMPDRHNLNDVMWPWDATQSHRSRPDSKLVEDVDRESYTPLDVLDHLSLGYDYDNLDPTGFRT